jgi:hypothetical protein
MFLLILLEISLVPKSILTAPSFKNQIKYPDGIIHLQWHDDEIRPCWWIQHNTMLKHWRILRYLLITTERIHNCLLTRGYDATSNGGWVQVVAVVWQRTLRWTIATRTVHWASCEPIYIQRCAWPNTIQPSRKVCLSEWRSLTVSHIVNVWRCQRQIR